MTLRWRMSDRLSVEYMSWARFVEEVEKVEEDSLPEGLMGYDLIWGGADLNLNIM